MEEILLKTTVRRRTFLKGAGLLGSNLLLLTLGGCDDIAEAIRNRPIRRRIRTGSVEVDRDIDIYRRAVSAMKALPSTDPRNWTRQAEIHGNNLNFTFCVHRTPHFPSWHRAYLFHFEKICQKLTNEPKFGLPYWNWQLNPSVPSQFLDTSSTLFSLRNRTTMAGNPAVQQSQMESIMSNSNYSIFNNLLEGTPHNTVHSNIGGVLGQGNSPMDPLFWLHHCMVDYCWANWNIARGFDSPSDASWINEEWTHFFDANGNPASSKAGLTTIMPLLAYQYEDSQIGDSLSTIALNTNSEFKKMKARVEKGAKLEFKIRQVIPVANGARLNIGKPFEIKTQLDHGQISKILETNTDDRLFASVRFAKTPDNNDFFVKVFVNAPNVAVNANETDQFYAGCFAFFGMPNPSDSTSSIGNRHPKMPEFLVDLTDTVNDLRRKKIIDGNTPITLQLVPVPFSDDQQTTSGQILDLDNIEIIVSPVKVVLKK